MKSRILFISLYCISQVNNLFFQFSYRWKLIRLGLYVQYLKELFHIFCIFPVITKFVQINYISQIAYSQFLEVSLSYALWQHKALKHYDIYFLGLKLLLLYYHAIFRLTDLNKFLMKLALAKYCITTHYFTKSMQYFLFSFEYLNHSLLISLIDMEVYLKETNDITPVIWACMMI